MFKRARLIFSFIDVLACALGGAIVLMLIFSVTQQGGDPPAGSPRDFIYYEVEIQNDPQALIRPVMKLPGEPWQAASLDAGGNIIIENDGFVRIEGLPSGNVFLWGPSVSLEDPSRERMTYHLYVPAPLGGDWKLGILYYSREELQEVIAPSDSTTLANLANQTIQVTHRVRTRLRDLPPEVRQIRLGRFSTVDFTLEQ